MGDRELVGDRHWETDRGRHEGDTKETRRRHEGVIIYTQKDIFLMAKLFDQPTSNDAMTVTLTVAVVVGRVFAFTNRNPLLDSAV